MKLSRILGLLAVLLVLPLTLALTDGGLRPAMASAECTATVGNCCLQFGAVCEYGLDGKLYNYIWSETGC